MPFIINPDTDELDYYESAIGTPGSSTDNAIVRWNGAGGDTIQDSGVTIDDNNNIIMPDGKYIGNSVAKLEFQSNRISFFETAPHANIMFSVGPIAAGNRCTMFRHRPAQAGLTPAGWAAINGSFCIWGAAGATVAPIFEVYNKYSTRVFKVEGTGSIETAGLKVSNAASLTGYIASTGADVRWQIIKANTSKKAQLEFLHTPAAPVLDWVLGTADPGNIAGCAGTEFFIGPDENTPHVWMEGGNFGIGVTSFGAAMAKGFAMKNGTAPTGNIADQFSMYSADQAAGNACPHIRTENGSIIKLYQAAKANYNNWANFSDIVDALVAIGLFDAA